MATRPLKQADRSPDAAPTGDLHLPSLVSWALAREPYADDARMLALLEPFRGQRFRLIRLLLAAGFSRPGSAGGLAFLTRTLGVVAGVALLGELVAARSATVGFLGAFEESLRASALAVAGALVFALVGRARSPLRPPGRYTAGP